MRTAAAAMALGLTLIAAAGLAACAPEDPAQPPGPSPSRTPVFASEEEALAAAEELYGEYERVTDEIGLGGWLDLGPLDEYLRADALEQETESALALAAQGYRQIGMSTFDSLTLQSVDDHGPGKVEVVIYVCGDVSGVDVVDDQGVSVVSENRPDRQALEVEIDDVDGDLKISRREAWSGANFC